MGWLKEDDVKPLKRLFKQRNTEGSLMGRGFNPPEKYQAGGRLKYYNGGGIGFSNPQAYQPFNALNPTGSFGQGASTPFTTAGSSGGGSGFGNFLSQGFKGLPGLGNIASGIGGLFSGLAGYNQAHSQKQALGHAISQAGKIPGMIDRMYQPGMERTQDLYDMYNPRGGQMFKSLQQNLGSVFNQNIGQVDPSMRKMLSRGNVAKASQAMQSMIPQFTQAQVGLSGQLSNMEQGMGQAQIGAHENLAQLQAARKAINPSAQALGSFGASLMSMVQGGGKVKKQSGEELKEMLMESEKEFPQAPTRFHNYNVAQSKRKPHPYARGQWEKNPATFDLKYGFEPTNYFYRTHSPYSGSFDHMDNPPNELSDEDYMHLFKLMKRNDKSYTDKHGKHSMAGKQLVMPFDFVEQGRLDDWTSGSSVIGSRNPIKHLLGRLGSKKAGGGYISGPHHGAGGVDMGNNIEAQGGEFVMNANAYNKNPSIIEALNMNDNEMTVMNGFFGDKHSAHGNSLNMQGGGELNTDEMSDYQKYLVVRGNKPSEFKDEADFNRKLDRHNQLNDPDYYEGESMTPLDSTWRNIEALTTSQVDGSKERVGDLSNQAWFINKHILPLLMENPPKVKQGGGVMNEGSLLNKIIKKTYGM